MTEQDGAADDSEKHLVDETDGQRNGVADPEAAEILDRAGYTAAENVLTPRQAEVLALRERGLTQTDIADRLGTSRANVSSVESSARSNVEKATATVAVAEALEAPVSLQIEPGTDLYDVPDRIYAACDEAEVKVEASTPELISAITDRGAASFDGRRLVDPVTVAVTAEGEIRIREP
ncbi:Tfx family DNA-binding protein [Salinarchaeum chitinilyticum]